MYIYISDTERERERERERETFGEMVREEEAMPEEVADVEAVR